MSLDLLVNLALGEMTPAPVVMPYERARMVARDRLLAIWCEKERGNATLYDRIRASRQTARELRRPLAIYTDDDLFDLSVTGVVDYYDQWWMRCTREVGESLSALRERYEQALRFSPLSQTVLLVGMDPPDLNEGEHVEHLQLCADLARASSEIVGVVWVGTPPSTTIASVAKDLLVLGFEPPAVVEVDPLEWGSGEAQP